MNRTAPLAFAVLLQMALLVLSPAFGAERWSAEQAHGWYDRQPWLVGANYIPANAINPLEMWQADTFDPATIEKELAWADDIGMNTMRVFLHDLLWEQDPKGFKRRIDQFLTIAARHGIKPMFVLFDSVWDPEPKLGPQRPPIPGVHNSGWVQAPGRARLDDAAGYGKLREYVQGVVGAFAKDDRILAWDVWNEPDNDGGGNYPKHVDKQKKVELLLARVFDWARSQQPVQPLTSGLWQHNDWSLEKLTAIERIQVTQSDVISFHDYNWPEVFERRVRQLQSYGRPLLCTEYMARGNGSTFDGSLPLGKRYNVAMFNWGLVDGKTQTRFPWDSWQKPYTLQEPPIWFHDVFRADGTPYRAAEVELIKRLTSEPDNRQSAQPTTVDIQGANEWKQSPHLKAYYELTVATFKNGTDIDVDDYEKKSFAVFRDFARANGRNEEGMVDHLKLIPRQVVAIVKEDASVLKSYDSFWAALAGPG